MTQLRERKKQQTRQTISHVATRLFIERGFERTTIADIAAAAEVSKMTVTNYFPRKEDLFFDAADTVIEWPARAVADRRKGESALAGLRRAYFEATERHDALLGRVSPGFARLIEDSPALRSRLREIYDQQEQALADAVADAAGPEGGRLEPLLAAAQLAAVLRILMEGARRMTLSADGGAAGPEASGARASGAGDDDAFFSALAQEADQAFTLLEPALGGYAVK